MNLKSSLFLLLALLGASATTQAQITYGGAPFHTQELPEAVALPALDRDALALEDDVTDRFKEAPWRFGVEHNVAWSCDHDGAWTLEQGHKVWRMVVDAPGATCMSVRFSEYDMPKGGQLFLYDAQGGNVLGALDHRNEKPWGGLATGSCSRRNWWWNTGNPCTSKPCRRCPSTKSSKGTVCSAGGPTAKRSTGVLWQQRGVQHQRQLS